MPLPVLPGLHTAILNFKTPLLLKCVLVAIAIVGLLIVWNSDCNCAILETSQILEDNLSQISVRPGQPGDKQCARNAGSSLESMIWFR